MSAFVTKETAGLWVIDVQEGLFPLVNASPEILEKICFTIHACTELGLPIFATEQYPKGLGHTVPAIGKLLEKPPLEKTTFSGYHDPKIRAAVSALPVTEWILVGIEAHICVLQTAKDLLAAGKKVIVLNDAISARSLYDFSTAIAEMREAGARISSSETVIYEMMRDAASPEFKQMLPLIKSYA